MIHDAEMRDSERVTVTDLVVGLADGDRYVRGNVSSGGVGFEIEDPMSLHVGDPITIRLTIPETSEPLALSAVVRHCQFRDHDGVLYVGARFVDVDELVQNPLDRYIEETALLHKREAPPSALHT